MFLCHACVNDIAIIQPYKYVFSTSTKIATPGTTGNA